VVILGEMNPAIHHPAWYKLESIIDETEYRACLSNPVIVNQQIAQFTSHGFSVMCLQDRWQASCNADDASRILSLTKETFKKLYHTPVSAYGVNHHFHIEINRQVGPVLAAIVRKTGMPFPPNEDADASISYAAKVDGYEFKTIISTSARGPEFLHFHNNAHFTIPQLKNEHFDLGPLIDEAFLRNEDRSRMMLSKLVDAIKGFK
jgi:hypothetical protein